MDIKSWSIIIGIFYVLLMGYVAWVAGKRTKSFRDFTIAGMKYGGIMIGLSVMATRLSGSALMGVPALAYKFGWSGFWIWVGAILASGVSVILVARRTRLFAETLGSYTVPDFLGDRYESNPVRGVLAFIVIIGLIPVMMAQFKATGLLFQGITGLPYWLGIVISAAIIVIYLGVGAMHAQILSDVVQAVFMMLVAIAVVPFGLYLVGGLSSLNAGLVEQNPALVDAFNPAYFKPHVALAIIPYFILILSVQAYSANRWFALKDVLQIKYVLLSFLVTYALAAMATMSGLIGRVVLGPDVAPDKVFITLSKHILHPAIAAFVMIGLYSAILSTVDGLLISVSHGVANDIYRKMIVPIKGGNPNSEDVERFAMILGRASMVVFALIPMYLAITKPPKFLSLILYAGVGIYTGAAFAPYLAGLYWRRATSSGALTAMIVGFVTAVICLFALKLTPFISCILAVIISSAVMLMVSLYTTAPRPDLVESLFKK